MCPAYLTTTCVRWQRTEWKISRTFFPHFWGNCCGPCPLSPAAHPITFPFGEGGTALAVTEEEKPAVLSPSSAASGGTVLSPSSAPSGHLPPRGKVLAWAKLKPSPLGKVDCPKGKTEEDNAVRSEDNSAKQEPKSPRLSPGALKTYSLFRCRLHHHPQIFHHLI